MNALSPSITYAIPLNNDIVPIVTAIAGIFIFVIKNPLKSPHIVPVKTPIKISDKVPAPCEDANPINTDDKAIIEDGILPDELIVIETQGQLSDGIRVKYSFVEEKEDESAAHTMP